MLLYYYIYSYFYYYLLYNSTIEEKEHKKIAIIIKIKYIKFYNLLLFKYPCFLYVMYKGFKK